MPHLRRAHQVSARDAFVLTLAVLVMADQMRQSRTIRMALVYVHAVVTTVLGLWLYALRFLYDFSSPSSHSFSVSPVVRPSTPITPNQLTFFLYPISVHLGIQNPM